MQEWIESSIRESLWQWMGTHQDYALFAAIFALLTMAGLVVVLSGAWKIGRKVYRDLWEFWHE